VARRDHPDPRDPGVADRHLRGDGAFGFSLNTLTLFGLVLAIGIVVDDAIVVVENVERNIAQGMSPRDAAHETMDEVGSAVLAIALVLSAVFVPTAFIPGISGQFYRQFALTIAVLDDHLGVQSR
jgi:HAE1 family hydrophobic/amphiphilic exporter-1